jgi:mannose-6-phosphate isomerase-like protein (cupin superfamily)
MTVPDGTQVSAFLNATDSSLDDVPAGLLDAMSIAAGRIAPGVRSWIHAHPALSQVTYVVSGALTVKMKDPREPEPYLLEVPAGSGVVTQPGTLLQLRNESTRHVEVLYIVSPSYVFEVGEDGRVSHDDSILVAEDWAELGPGEWDAYATDEALRAARTRRTEALERLAANDR